MMTLYYKKLLMLIVFSLLILSLSSLVEETASLQDFLYGSTDLTSYDNFYSRIVKGLASEDYNQYAPWEVQNNEFGNFRLPNSTELWRWNNVVRSFLEQNFGTALQLIGTYNFPYEIVKFTDTDTDRTYYMLRELLNSEYFDDNGMPDNPELHQEGSFDYGWGLYIFNPESQNPVIITTPHPKDDFITVPVSCLAFQKWDARYLMIAGTGREAMWTEVEPYTNAKSLSDPTRRQAHPFNTFYQAACGDIRDTFGRIEFSAQIHSFDYTHSGYNSLQISAGNSSQNYPGLPIRDISGNYMDIVNAAPYVIFPENSIGNNREVLVTDYYSVHYSTHGHYYDNDGEFEEISNNINLPGFINNRQVLYTLGGRNKYDVFSPFFHIEMEELPSCYEQDLQTYHWFYGFDAGTETWDAENHFSNAILFYTPWLQHMQQVLPYAIDLDDGEPPTPPTNLVLNDLTYYAADLQWQRAYSYDFETYEILHATEPINIDQPNYSVVNRRQIDTLAGQAFITASIRSLQPGLSNHVAIRAKDYNGNYSDLSNHITVHPIPAVITHLRAYGRDSSVDLEWLVESQRNNQGFIVYRHDVEAEVVEIVGSWETDGSLIGGSGNNVLYEFTDGTAENGTLYEYYLASYSHSGQEDRYHHRAEAVPDPIYSLHFRNSDNSITDAVEFGYNLLTTDDFDPDYDIEKDEEPGVDNFIHAAFYLPRDWQVPNRFLQRDINSYYDINTDFKKWRLRVSSNLLGETIYLSISDNYDVTGASLLLECNRTNELFDLTTDIVELQVDSEDYQYFTLYWGKLSPHISITPAANQYLQAGEEFTLLWRTELSHLIETLELYLLSDDDSLLIAGNIDRDENRYNWNVPDNISLSNALFYLRAETEGGHSLVFASPFKVGVLPSEQSLTSTAGWHLKANFLEHPQLYLTDIFGDEALFFTDNLLIPDTLTVFEFGKGYWVFHEDDLSYSLSGSARKHQYDIELLRGWNLIPNVFGESIEKANLTIVGQHPFGGTVAVSFKEAVTGNSVSPSVYGFEDNRYVLADTLNKGQAYWIYSLKNDLTLRFAPFAENAGLEPLEETWNVTVQVQQSAFLKDEIIIGAPEGYFAPKPPPRPGRKLHFYINEGISPFEKLHSKHKIDLAEDVDDARYWNFIVEIEPMITPITFSYLSDTLPENYAVALVIDEIFVNLSEEQEYTYIPTSSEVRGSLMVTNETILKTEFEPTRTVLLPNYPNPFIVGNTDTRSGGTNISFFLPKQTAVKVEVFNIKGQRVKLLVDDNLSSGKQSLYWDGKGDGGKSVSSGIYFYKLKTEGEEPISGKMLLLR